MSIFKGDTCLTGDKPSKKPDWANKIEVSTAQIRNGYTIPKDGELIGMFANDTAQSYSEQYFRMFITEGSVTSEVLRGYTRADDGLRPVYIQMPVSKGQIFSVSMHGGGNINNFDAKFCHMVPWKE